jgi:hypothetical protein
MTKVTEKGLKNIDRLTSLRSLNLAGLSIGKRSLSRVGKLKKLETLLIGGVQANDDAVGFDWSIGRVRCKFPSGVKSLVCRSPCEIRTDVISTRK